MIVSLSPALNPDLIDGDLNSEPKAHTEEKDTSLAFSAL